MQVSLAQIRDKVLQKRHLYIKLLDHVIVTNHAFYSFAAKGVLTPFLLSFGSSNFIGNRTTHLSKLVF